MSHRPADHDVVVIGGGPAGLAAATWLGRYRRRTLVLDAEEPRNRWVVQAHGYLGSDPCDPAELRQRALQDLARYPDVEVACRRVERAAAAGPDAFALTTAEGTVTARRVILATGVADAFPDVEGFFTHYGASVFHCPTCDGYEAREQPVVVFGWSEQVAGFALTLLDWAASVTVVTDGHRFHGDAEQREALERHGVDILTDDAIRFVGERGDLRGVELARGGVLPATLVFFSIAHQPVTGIADQLGCDLDSDGHVRVDAQQATSVAGVYAAGDLTPGMQLVQVAAAEGAVAGVACAHSLRGQRGSSARDAPDVEAELEGG